MNQNLNPVGMAVDTWIQSLGSLCWAQDQSDQLLRSWMDQGKLAREQGRELSQQLADQTKKNQIELQKFIHNTVALSLETVQRNHQHQMMEMETKVRQMSEMVTSLQNKVSEMTSVPN